MSAVGFASGPLWGYLADRVIGRERTLALCLAGTVAGRCCSRSRTAKWPLAITGSVAWSSALRTVALADALALDRLGSHRRDAYGSVRLWMSASFAVGAIAWGAVIEAAGHRRRWLRSTRRARR